MFFFIFSSSLCIYISSSFRLKRGVPNSSVTCSSKAYPPITVEHTHVHPPILLGKSINPRNSSSKVCIPFHFLTVHSIDEIHMKTERCETYRNTSARNIFKQRGTFSRHCTVGYTKKKSTYFYSVKINHNNISKS